MLLKINGLLNGSRAGRGTPLFVSREKSSCSQNPLKQTLIISMTRNLMKWAHCYPTALQLHRRFIVPPSYFSVLKLIGGRDSTTLIFSTIQKETMSFRNFFCIQFSIDTFSNKERTAEIETETNKIFLSEQEWSVVFSKFLNTQILQYL